MKKIRNRKKLAFTLISKACESGFTLIELLVVISIIGLLLFAGFAYYQDFNRRQVVNQAAKELKNNLRLAQSKALAGEKPEGCLDTLEGYVVEFSPNSYTIHARCSQSGDIEFGTYPLVSGVSIVSGPSWTLIKVLTHGVENPGVITLSGPAHSTEVELKESGEITLNENVPYLPIPTPTQVSLAGCGVSCAADNDCQEGLSCGSPCPPGGEMGCAHYLFCHNPACGLDPDCVCDEPSPPTPTPTPTCVPEGGNKIIYPGAPDCCPGLTVIGNYQIDEKGCHFLLGASTCAFCPNGVCGLGENYCNCPEDCPSP